MGQHANGQPMVLAGDTVLDVFECRCCGGQHNHIQARRYSRDNPPFTHFFICPEGNEPVECVIAQTGNMKTILSDRILRDLFQYCYQPHVFVTAGVRTDGHIDVTIHRHNFQVERFDELLKLIGEACDDMRPMKKPDKPLPKADMQSLFGPGGAVALAATQPAPIEAIEQAEPGNQSEQGSAVALLEPVAAETPPAFDQDIAADKDPESDE